MTSMHGPMIEESELTEADWRLIADRVQSNRYVLRLLHARHPDRFIPNSLVRRWRSQIVGNGR